ncbi:hypothetical protein QFZ87_004447 [Bacillus sp. SLBN-46]|uniref:hypothetical protein n=1 Tax=Bacillus sp. SLBN-46 TaxID=3042283 RepID=UPI00285A9B33|nr:hypothetical protein [Bacillus sp. SLBN-46]MDR6124850.1 hypothetical protein [Bacillus sp. SLBN-46]
MAKMTKRCCFYGPNSKGQLVVRCISSTNICLSQIHHGGEDLDLFSASALPVENCGDCHRKIAIPGLEGFTIVSADEDEN